MDHIERHLIEISAKVDQILEASQKHERSLYGLDGGNGIVSDVKRHNELERKANRIILWVGGLIIANVGTLIKALMAGEVKIPTP